MGFFRQICLLHHGKVAAMFPPLLALLLLPIAILGAPPAEPAADAEARAALRQAVVFHRQAKDIAFKFDAEVYNADLDKRDSYRGRLLLKDSTRFRLEIPGGTYVSDGKSFWEYHPKNKQVVVRDAEDMAGQP